VIIEYQNFRLQESAKYRAGPMIVQEGKLYTTQVPDSTPGKLLYLVASSTWPS
jgi:hypothetical protein